jgi:hypothetical protein
MRPLAYEMEGDFTLIPGCCLHYPEGEKGLIQKFVARVAGDPWCRVILMGDMIDQDRTHRRKYRRGYVEDENSVASHDDRHNRSDVEALARLLAPIRSQIWGVLQGNHYYQYASGVTSDQYLCELLDVPYCGPVGVFRITVATKGDHRNLKIWSHHSGGSTGGRTLGGSVNALLRQENSWDADIFLLGHDHRRICWRESSLTLTEKGDPQVIERTKVFARVGAFLKTYKHEGCIPKKSIHIPGYGEKAAYRPADLGWVEIGVTLKRHHRSPTRFAYDLRVPDCQ